LWLALLLWPALAGAWEEEQALAFIAQQGMLIEAPGLFSMPATPQSINVSGLRGCEKTLPGCSRV
jgi:hypothetical protein